MKSLPIFIKVGAPMAALAICFVCTVGFKGNSMAAMAGTYDLKLSDEAVSVCEWLQASVPAGRLMLSEDGEYRLERYVEGRRLISEGEYELEGSEIVLNREDSRKTLRGRSSRNHLTIEGLSFERSGFESEIENPAPRRELPREPQRELPRTLPREEPRRESPREIELPTRTPFSAVGRWVVENSNGRVDRSIRLEFTADGGFSFSGMGGTSRGTYKVEDDRILLRYQEVDGQRVEFPYNGRAYISGDGFRIDNFRYVRD